MKVKRAAAGCHQHDWLPCLGDLLSQSLLDSRESYGGTTCVFAAPVVLFAETEEYHVGLGGGLDGGFEAAPVSAIEIAALG